MKLHPQYRFAAALALTRTAKEVEKDIYREMGKVFDKLTPYTSRSLFTKPAKKDNLVTSVGLKTIAPSKAKLSPNEVLGHQFMGGKRRHNNLEGLLINWGRMSKSECLIPTEFARKDEFGNISRGQVMQIISQLKISIDQNQNSSNSKRSKKNVKKSGGYFWSFGGHLARGVWARLGARNVKPILIVGSAATYKKALDIQKVGDESVNKNMAPNFEKAWQQAINSAR